MIKKGKKVNYLPLIMLFAFIMAIASIYYLEPFILMGPEGEIDLKIKSIRIKSSSQPIYWVSSYTDYYLQQQYLKNEVFDRDLSIDQKPSKASLWGITNEVPYKSFEASFDPDWQLYGLPNLRVRADFFSVVKDQYVVQSYKEEHLELWGDYDILLTYDIWADEGIGYTEVNGLYDAIITLEVTSSKYPIKDVTYGGEKAQFTKPDPLDEKHVQIFVAVPQQVAGVVKVTIIKHLVITLRLDVILEPTTSYYYTYPTQYLPTKFTVATTYVEPNIVTVTKEVIISGGSAITTKAITETQYRTKLETEIVTVTQPGQTITNIITTKIATEVPEIFEWLMKSYDFYGIKIYNWQLILLLGLLFALLSLSSFYKAKVRRK